jgi:hypothetical protein
VKQERPTSGQHDPYGTQTQRKSSVSTQPRGNGQTTVREAERIAGERAMVEPQRHPLGWYLANWFTLLVVSALAFFETVLSLRLFFKLTSADSANGFVDLIYRFSGVVIQPFTGIISPVTIVKGGILEPSVLMAMGVYLIGAILLIWVVRSLATIKSWGGLFWPMK